VSPRRGIPATEAAELEGLQYRAAQARAELAGTVAAAADMAASCPPAGRLAWRLSTTAARRLAREAWDGLREPIPGRAALPAAGGAYGWAIAAALAGVLVAGILAAGAVRQAQNGRLSQRARSMTSPAQRLARRAVAAGR
jgi:hypothetical protein